MATATTTTDTNDVNEDALLTDGVDLTVDGDEINLDWAFWKPQLEAIQCCESDLYDIVAFLGGFRSGKSVTGARYTIEVALDPRYAPARCLAMGKTTTEAKKTTYPVLFEELPGDNLDPYLGDGDPENSPIVRKFAKRDGVITLINDSVIILASADKPNRYDGGKFSMAWLDEACHYNDRLPGIMTTIGERFDYKPTGPQVQLWTSTGNGRNEAYDILERREKPTSGDPVNLRIYRTVANSLENPFLDDADRQRLIRTHEGGAQSDQSLRGEFSKPEGMVYSNFNRVDHMVDPSTASDMLDGSGWRIYGYDEGWKDPRVLIEIGRTDHGQLLAVDEFYRSGTHIEDAIAWLDDGGHPKGRIYCEHEPSDIKKFQSEGWQAGRAKKSVQPGISQVRKRLRKDAKGRPGFLVSEACENLIDEFMSYTEDDVQGSDVKDHALDSTRYAIFTDSKLGSSSGGSSTTVDKA